MDPEVGVIYFLVILYIVSVKKVIEFENKLESEYSLIYYAKLVIYK